MIDNERITRIFQRHLKETGESLRDISIATGISHSTLHRGSHGVGKMDADNLFRLCSHLQIPINGTQVKKSEAGIRGVIEAIDADRKLSRKAKASLIELMEVAYREFRLNQ